MKIITAKEANHNFDNGSFEIYDENGYRIYLELSDGFWIKRIFDANGNVTYIEKSCGYWERHKYNANGNEIYYSDYMDQRGYY